MDENSIDLLSDAIIVERTRRYGPGYGGDKISNDLQAAAVEEASRSTQGLALTVQQSTASIINTQPKEEDLPTGQC